MILARLFQMIVNVFTNLIHLINTNFLLTMTELKTSIQLDRYRI